ncbi:MAG: ribosome biogenesis GTPase Der [Saprospiraceae bacterium]|nr:ribosome biogenesis GTPase Der [Saprospiraceae bacterium]
MGNVVAIVGRPNVGKSTLYNRLIGERQAIVDDRSGVTRDRQYGHCEWNGRKFSVIDTGGFVRGSDDIFEAAIREQVEIAMSEASQIIFMVDTTTGITDLDEEIADILRRSPKEVFVVVNKVDNLERQLRANEFWSLGFERVHFVSSLSGSGTGELLDALTEIMEDTDQMDDSLPKIAIVGQPNVGKSSLTNALLGEERNIVTEIEGTTRDSIYTKYDKFGKEFYLIDTAGIRKKSKVHENLEFYSVIRAVKAIEEADVVILLMDATKGVEAQDLAILSMAIKKNKGVVIAVNKWDLVEKETMTAKNFEDRIKRKIAPFNDVPVIFTSVLDKQRIFRVIETAIQVYQNRTKRIKTSKLNQIMLEVIKKTPPPSYRGRFIKIKYVSQLPLAYPAFAFFCNHPKHVRPAYMGFLENKLREYFDFTGVPIKVFMREK